MPSPSAVEVLLSGDERDQLEAWARRRSSAQALAERSRIVLLAAEGLKNTAIAERLGIGRGTAAKWRSRFVSERLEGLLDEPRPGRPRTVTDAQVEEVIVRTLETTPRDATHWSTRSLASELGLSQSAVARIWRAFGLQPHRQQTWKLSRDPQFIDKVRDVVGLYLDPPERAVVLCVDVKSQIPLDDEAVVASASTWMCPTSTWSSHRTPVFRPKLKPQMARPPRTCPQGSAHHHDHQHDSNNRPHHPSHPNRLPLPTFPPDIPLSFEARAPKHVTAAHIRPPSLVSLYRVWRPDRDGYSCLGGRAA